MADTANDAQGNAGIVAAAKGSDRQAETQARRRRGRSCGVSEWLFVPPEEGGTSRAARPFFQAITDPYALSIMPMAASLGASPPASDGAHACVVRRPARIRLDDVAAPARHRAGIVSGVRPQNAHASQNRLTGLRANYNN